MAYSVMAATLAVAVVYGHGLFRVLSGGGRLSVSVVILLAQTAIEVLASFYVFAAVFSAAAYLFGRDEEPAPDIEGPAPPIGILSLCCDDLDVRALESLLTFAYRGPVYLIIHDDSQLPSSRALVDRVVRDIRGRTRFEVLLLRRPEKTGGKAGAVNYVLQQTGHLYPYFLLCDNDSTVVDPFAIEKALPYLEDEQVAIVQCRSVAVDDRHYCALNRLLARSTDVFHLFLTVCARFGWRLFIGHNALLRTDAVLGVGGLTPGFFSDDLDLAIRLNLRGYTIVYAPAAKIGEKHPPSYDAFRRRTYKWSYGCMQMLKAHARTVLTSPMFTLAEKVSFFYFTGFYVGQVVLLLYLALTYLVEPLCQSPGWPGSGWSLLAGTMMVLLVYLPTCAYFLKHRALRGSIGSIVMCGLVYGSTDFACVAGAWDGLRGKKRRWIPTNAVSQEFGGAGLLFEALFGLVLLATPLLLFPALLYLPCAYLFAGKFLFGPAISLLYRDSHPAVETAETRTAAA